MRRARVPARRRDRWWLSLLLAAFFLLFAFVTPSPNSFFPAWLETTVKVVLAIGYGAMTIVQLARRRRNGPAPTPPS